MTDSFIGSTDSRVDSSRDSSEVQRLTPQAIPDAQAPSAPYEMLSPTTANAWARRRDTILTILLWILAVGIVFWLLSHVGRVILLLVISGLIAFALAPLTILLSRFLPRPLAIILVYCAMLGAIGGLGYLVVSAATLRRCFAYQPGPHLLVLRSAWFTFTTRTETHSGRHFSVADC